MATMAVTSVQQAFDLAVQHHRGGRLAEAEDICRQVLAQQPNHADDRQMWRKWCATTAGNG